MSKPHIGFIGLGLMGGNMAANLLNKGYPLTVMDLNADAVAKCTDAGANKVDSGKALAEQCDIIMLCLTTSNIVEKVIYSENGLLEGMSEGQVLIDFGTSVPESTRKIGADLAAKGVGMVDAPLGRTPAHAKDGLLNIMAAGDKATFDKVQPILADQGENVFYLGALGAGHTTKLINNFMGMTTVCTMSQAFAVAKKSGVDLQMLFDIMSTGPSSSPFMQFCKNYAVDNVSDLGFSLNNANKDVGYFLQMVSDLGTESKIAEASYAALEAALAAGMGEGNVPEIYDYFLQLDKK